MLNEVQSNTCVPGDKQLAKLGWYYQVSQQATGIHLTGQVYRANELRTRPTTLIKEL